MNKIQGITNVTVAQLHNFKDPVKTTWKNEPFSYVFSRIFNFLRWCYFVYRASARKTEK